MISCDSRIFVDYCVNDAGNMRVFFYGLGVLIKRQRVLKITISPDIILALTAAAFSRLCIRSRADVIV